MKKIQFILMASFVLGTCQLAVLSGAADELDVKESTIELSNNFVENSQVDNVQISSETVSEQVVEKAESNSETKENSLLPSSNFCSLILYSFIFINFGFNPIKLFITRYI